MKRTRANGGNKFARYGLRGHTVRAGFHSYRGGVRR